MRRQLQRTVEAAERQNRAAWLASLTTEHRAVHERITANPFGGLCSECMQAGARQLGELMGRVLTSMQPSRVGLGDSNDQ